MKTDAWDIPGHFMQSSGGTYEEILATINFGGGVRDIRGSQLLQRNTSPLHVIKGIQEKFDRKLIITFSS